LRSVSPWNLSYIEPKSSRTSGTPKPPAMAFAARLLHNPARRSSSTPLGGSRPGGSGTPWYAARRCATHGLEAREPAYVLELRSVVFEAQQSVLVEELELELGELGQVRNADGAVAEDQVAHDAARVREHHPAQVAHDRGQRLGLDLRAPPAIFARIDRGLVAHQLLQLLFVGGLNAKRTAASWSSGGSSIWGAISTSVCSGESWRATISRVSRSVMA
jgi:hypothetical protein